MTRKRQIFWAKNGRYDPQKLDIHDPNLSKSFMKWKRELLVYTAATERDQKPAVKQTAIILNCAGPEFIQMYGQFTWETEADKNNTDKVIEKLEGYCSPQGNVVVNSFRFWKLPWMEPFDVFLTELRSMAELCENYADLERMLRDNIVFSAHRKLQELLPRDNKLTLDNAVSICREFELTKRQVQEITSTEKMVDRVESHVSKQTRSGYQDKKTNDMKKECQYCGYSHEPGRRKCPAWGKICSHCHGHNHFKAKCRKKINCVLETDDPENDDDWLQAHALTFGVTGDAKQKRIIAMMEVSIIFQLDTGSDINTINQRFVRKDQVRHTGEKLVMWNGTKLTPKGASKLMTTNVKTASKDEVDFVVVDNGLTYLICSTTIRAMGLMTIHGERFISQIDKVDDLGNLGMAALITDCDIAPKILPCRKIPIALQQGVNTELDTLVKRGILVPVDEPTQWVTQMAVVVKQNGNLRLCLDPQPLNQALMRERYKLSALDDVLPSRNNAKLFSKLDVQEAFWHVELDEQSSILTTMITPYGRYRWAMLPFGMKVSSEIFPMISLLLDAEQQRHWSSWIMMTT